MVWFADGNVSRLEIVTELKFDCDAIENEDVTVKDLQEAKIKDQVFQCTGCHAYFVASWKLMSFQELAVKKKDE